MVQGRKIEVLVLQKVVVGISHAPVAVAEQDKARTAIQGKYRGVTERIGYSCIPSHVYHLRRSVKVLFLRTCF